MVTRFFGATILALLSMAQAPTRAPDFIDFECWAAEAPTATDVPTGTTAPTETTTPTTEPSATATETELPTRSVPAPTYEIYIPGAMREAMPDCRDERFYADVVLVLDMSTSMYRETRAGRSKHDAAIEAAREFVALLDAAGDRAAVVGFNDQAWIQSPLSGDMDAARTALFDLRARIAEGTRLDLAVQRGADAWAEPLASPNRPVMILLTDGLPNRVPTPPSGGAQEDTVLAAARAAKAQGVRIYSIGLGAEGDIDKRLLGDVASAPDMFYHAPDGEDLADIYRAIAGRVRTCSDGGGDGVPGAQAAPPAPSRLVEAAGPPAPSIDAAGLVDADGRAVVDGLAVELDDIPRDEIVLVGARVGAPSPSDMGTVAARIAGVWVPELDVPAAGVRAIWTRGRDGALPWVNLGAIPSVEYLRRPLAVDIPVPETPRDMPDPIRPQQGTSSPNDPYYLREWQLDNVTGARVPGAWAITTGRGVRLYVIDTGVDCSHVDLRCSDGPHYYATSRRQVGKDQARDEEIGHGTFVAGTAGAIYNNARGVAGVAPDIEIVMVQVCSAGGTCSELDITAGAAWAAAQAAADLGEHGAVFNLSLGGGFTTRTQAMCDVLAKARDVSGVIVVAAVGNGGRQTPLYPASCTGVIGAGATDKTGDLAEFSERASVDLVAPGVKVVSTCPHGQYGEASGTSFSSPMVAGAASLLRAVKPDTPPAELEGVLFETARRTGRWGYCGPVYNHRVCGWGMLDVESAVRFLYPDTPTSAPTPATPEATGTATPSPRVVDPTESPTPSPTHLPAVQTAIARLTQTAEPTPVPPAPTDIPAPTDKPPVTSSPAATLEPGTATAAAIATGVAGTETAEAPTPTPDVPGTLTAVAPSPTPADPVKGTVEARRAARTQTAEAPKRATFEAIRRLVAFLPIAWANPVPPTPTPPPWVRVDRTATAEAEATATVDPFPRPLAAPRAGK